MSFFNHNLLNSNQILILLIYLISNIYISEGSVCSRLIPTNGVELKCSAYSEMNHTEIHQHCTTIRSKLNTIARYNCKPNYTPNEYDDNERGGGGGGVMKCTRRGKWRNISQFKKFKCQLSAKGWIDEVIDTNQVVIFSLSYCGYCHKLKQMFRNLNVKYFAIELDLLVDERKSYLLKDALRRKTGMNTYPNVFVSRKHIGGFDNTNAAFHAGVLHNLLDLYKPSHY